ncbi:DNA methyltransferase [Hyphomicrobium sp. MC1]|uniref:DNA modification methylase n=1 Tax=Hyphomicrobium sp. (strain MC1) TaxID=717785 RepID=UPI000213F23F|nr:DNA methyltransferase [Hyphomicrobium sp. MC1]CCB66724.1 putative phage methyltransferase [Hyphomicrobium sp. MC1]
MSARETINSRALKKQLQTATKKRRSNNHDETRITAALHVHGRNDPQPVLATVFKPVNSLRPSANRTRETTAQLLESVIRSIMKFGMVLPILIDKNGTIIAGHVLWEAAVRLGLETIECRVVDHLNPVELEALSLALNRIGEIGKYNLDKLRDRMVAIESHGIELISTGFTLPEIDQIKLEPLPIEHNSEEDEGADDTVVGPTSRAGDLFRLGRHQLLCGDALDEASYKRVLSGSAAHAAFTDPPYNCRIEGFVGGLGKHKHEDFVMFAGKESEAEFRKFLQTYLTLCRASLLPEAVLFACMDWRQIDLLLDAGRDAGLDRINVAVWNKGSGGMGGLYRSCHELIGVFCNGKSPALNNVALGAFGRDRTNVWTYPGANRRGSSAAQALADHPTPKPVELIIDALLDVTHADHVVLDPFAGSGTTIIASERCDREARGIELDPKYVDRAIRRWERLTGDRAVHVETGLTFAELVEQRADDGQSSHE